MSPVNHYEDKAIRHIGRAAPEAATAMPTTLSAAACASPRLLTVDTSPPKDEFDRTWIPEVDMKEEGR